METQYHRGNQRVRKHLNKISLQGIVITNPKFKPLSSGTPSLVFKICSYETFQSHGRTSKHENEFIVEALGSTASRAARTIKKGQEYVFDGYLRSDKYMKDGKRLQRIRVRIFHVEQL